MIDILTELHDHYLPAVEHKNTSGTTILERCFFGGDQLTDERARNSALARCDGDDMFEQLKGFIPKADYWHCGRLIYQVKASNIFEDIQSLSKRLSIANIHILFIKYIINT